MTTRTRAAGMTITPLFQLTMSPVKTVRAYPSPVDGLIVARRVDRYSSDHGRPRWTVYHAASSIAVCGLRALTRAEAMAFAESLRGVADWTLGKDDLLDKFGGASEDTRTKLTAALEAHRKQWPHYD